MASRLSFESRRLLQMLSDGHWADLDTVKDSLAQTVAPGRAIRTYDIREANRRKHSGTSRIKGELSDDRKIASGRRTLVHQTFWSLGKRHIEVDHENKMVRIRPEVLNEVLAESEGLANNADRFPDPDDTTADEEFDFEPQPTTGPLDEQQIRAIIEEVVEAQLDAFQLGMQDFLYRSFARLERLLLARLHEIASRQQGRRRR